MIDKILIEEDEDGDGVVVQIPGFFYGGTQLGSSCVWLEWAQLRQLRDTIIEFLGANQ